MTRIVLTHAHPRVERVARRLRERGHEVLACPVRTLASLAGKPRAAAALADAGERDWIVLVSPGAIDAALGELRAPLPESVGVAVIGPGSAQALAEHGIAPPRYRIVVPRAAPYDAQALMATPPFDAPQGLRVLVLNGTRGRRDWIDALAARGAQVERIAIYRSETTGVDPGALARLGEWSREPDRALFVFTSTDAVREVDGALERVHIGDWARAQPAVAPHARIVGALRERGWRAARQIEPGERALLGAIEST